MTTTLIRRTGALALIAVTTTALTGCAGVLGARMTYNDSVPTKITELVLNGGSGDVAVTTAAVDATTIKRIVRGSANPGESYRLTGTSLTLDTSCGHNCSVSYEIQAPAGVSVRGTTDSGDITLNGAGATDLKMTSGDLLVKDASGPVAVRATSGDVQVLDAKGAVTLQITSGNARAIGTPGPVRVKATSGNVDVVMTAPNSVSAELSSGDVHVVVPAGNYRINARTGSGASVVNGLTDDPTSKNVIDVRTGSGDATVSTAA